MIPKTSQKMFIRKALGNLHSFFAKNQQNGILFLICPYLLLIYLENFQNKAMIYLILETRVTKLQN